jgi:hypothetical protein
MLREQGFRGPVASIFQGIVIAGVRYYLFHIERSNVLSGVSYIRTIIGLYLIKGGVYQMHHYLGKDVLMVNRAL